MHNPPSPKKFKKAVQAAYVGLFFFSSPKEQETHQIGVLSRRNQKKKKKEGRYYNRKTLPSLLSLFLPRLRA